jgi:N utilization substance protein B
MPDLETVELTPRRRSRETALQLLFLKAFAPDKGLESAPKGLLADFIRDFEIDLAVAEYGGILFLGVCENLEKIDLFIEANARHWKVARMSLVDLSILRIAVFEMAFLQPQLKANIAINEAVELARLFGSTDSASFVNGILDPIARQI